MVDFPKGTILPWFSTEAKAPAGWHLCNGVDHKLNLEGLWLVGTNDPKAVGQPSKMIPVVLNFTGSASATGTAEKYPVDGHAGPAPHAPGTNHTHAVSGSATISAGDKITPPSIMIRYIIKV